MNASITTKLQREAEIGPEVESSNQQQMTSDAPTEKEIMDIDTTGETIQPQQDASSVVDLVRAFSAAYIPLTMLHLPGLVDYLRANLDDPTDPKSCEQLKQCYQRFISEELDSPPLCSVSGCNITYADKRTIFAFPDCKESVKLWKQALNLKNRDRYVGVCELHFEEDFLIRDAGKSRVTLMPGAVPRNSKKPPVAETGLTAVNNHCRMCGLTIKYCMQHNITELQSEQRLRPVLDMCLELKDSVHQLLPVMVCDGCTNMVRFIGVFVQSCWDAQQKLLRSYVGITSRKFEPWNRVYQHVEPTESEEFQIISTTTETSEEPTPPEETVPYITEDEPTAGNSNDKNETAHIDAPIQVRVDEQPSENCSVESNLDTSDTPKPILVKPEPLEKDILTIVPDIKNDENDDRELNQQRDQPPLKKPRHSKEAASGNTGTSERTEKFTCKLCLQEFSKQTELVIHSRKHALEHRTVKHDVLLSGWFFETIKCLQCRKTFPTPEELKAHTSEMHRSDAYCPICGMRFRNNEVLEQHRKRAKRCLIKANEPAKIQ